MEQTVNVRTFLGTVLHSLTAGAVLLASSAIVVHAAGALAQLHHSWTFYAAGAAASVMLAVGYLVVAVDLTRVEPPT